MSVHLFLRPLDVWLFRDGKPFNQGSDHRAKSVFPPLPTVIQGAIRTHYIEQHGGIPAYLAGKLPEVETFVGKKGQPPPETLQIRGPFVVHRQSEKLVRYTPLPNHIYQRDKQTYRLLSCQSLEPDVITNLDTPAHLLWPDEGTEPGKMDIGEGGLWLSETALRQLLTEKKLVVQTNSESNDHVQGNRLFTRETRLGIGRDDDSLSSEEGAIYQAEFIRLRENVGLYVAVNGMPDWPDQGVLMLGGEGHTAAYQKIAEPEFAAPVESASGKFSITFLTPTYFKLGWQPEDWNIFWNGAAKLVAAAVNRPDVLGGFDVANKQHKPARRYVSAGNTYYFEGDVTFRDSCICDNPADGRIGFGQFILGEWE